MPRVSDFYGIAISMYDSDHAPPHFHAEHGEDEGPFTIETLELLIGDLPRVPSHSSWNGRRCIVTTCGRIGSWHARACRSKRALRWIE